MRTLLLLLPLILAGCLPPQPEPGPGPSPDPPGPQPVVDSCWLITVSETGERTPEQAEILNALEFWTGLESLGCHFRHYDDDQTAAAAYVAKAREKNVSLPALLITSPTGNLLRCVELPNTTAAIRSLVKEVTGK